MGPVSQLEEVAGGVELAWSPPSQRPDVRGLGVMFRVSEPLGNWDGEPE